MKEKLNYYDGSVQSWEEWLEIKEQGYNAVRGDFDCSNNKLTSLEGCPFTVGGESLYCDFDCSNNLLTSLEGAPKYVGFDFYCKGNKLEVVE